MTKTFNKTLLATALLAAAGVANAATITEFAPVGLSKQASNALTINGPAFQLDASVAYPAGTEFVVTFSAGELSVAPTATAKEADTTTDKAGVTITRIAQTPTTATFRIDAGTVLATEFVEVAGYQFTRASALAQPSITATVLVKADTGVVIDTAGTGDKLTRNVLLVGEQFASVVSPTGGFAKEISLASVRTKFTGNNPADREFTIQVNTTNRAGVAYKDDADADQTATFAASATAGADSVKYTVSGDFSWLVDTNAATAGIQAAAGTFTLDANCALGTVTASSLVYTCDGAAAGATSTDDLKINVFQGGTKAPAALQDGVYTVSAEVNHTVPTGTFATLTNAKAGEFTNDGTTVNVYYVPYGAGISQILYVTNTTSQVGKIYATAYDEAGTKLLDGVEVGMTTPNGITQVSGTVRAALGDSYSGKVALTFDIETSGAQVFSAYNVSGDRLATK